VGARLFVEALAQADHRGGRRHVWHGAKSKPGSVVALMVEGRVAGGNRTPRLPQIRT